MASTSRSGTAKSAGSHSGASLVEVMVILVIIAILLALMLSRFQAGKRTALTKQAITAGQTYADAVQAFALDHGGRVPAGGNTNEWRTGADIGKGPLHKLGKLTDTFYIRGGVVPEVVISGTVTITFTDSPGAPNKANLAYITKTSGGAPFPNGFELKTYVSGRYVCSLGDDLGAPGPADNDAITCQ